MPAMVYAIREMLLKFSNALGCFFLHKCLLFRSQLSVTLKMLVPFQPMERNVANVIREYKSCLIVGHKVKDYTEFPLK